jgi:hypothetical protein
LTVETLLQLLFRQFLTVTEHDSIDRFGSNMERLKAPYVGTPVPPPHPFAVALLEARYLPTRVEKVAEHQRRLELQINGMKQQREEAGGGSPAHYRKDTP